MNEDAFNAFWDAYGKKERKRCAKEAFAAASEKVDPWEIVQAARSYAERRAPEPKYWPSALNWLRQERWDDEPVVVPDSQPNVFEDSIEKTREAEEQSRMEAVHRREILLALPLDHRRRLLMTGLEKVKSGEFKRLLLSTLDETVNPINSPWLRAIMWSEYEQEAPPNNGAGG